MIEHSDGSQKQTIVIQKTDPESFERAVDEMKFRNYEIVACGRYPVWWAILEIPKDFYDTP